LSKLEDYSGDFKPDLKPSDLSYEALEKLIRVYGKLYKALDGFWYLNVMDKHGNGEAQACDISVWERLAGYESEKIVQAFNITGSPVTRMMKAFQLSPWAWNLKTDYELVNENRIIWRVLHCPTVAALERENMGREQSQCNFIEQKVNEAYAHHFHPKMKVNCLKAPPREGKDDYFCKWEFILEE
jgi:hypothetical protein